MNHTLEYELEKVIHERYNYVVEEHETTEDFEHIRRDYFRVFDTIALKYITVKITTDKCGHHTEIDVELKADESEDWYYLESFTQYI